MRCDLCSGRREGSLPPLVTRHEFGLAHGTPSSQRHGAWEEVTGRDNRWLKKFRSALRESAIAKDGCIAVEGPHLVQEALNSRLRVAAALASPGGSEKFAALLDQVRLRDPSVRMLRTTDKMFASVAGTERPQGVAALVQPRAWTLDEVMRSGSLLVVLLGIQDPGNTGTIIRSAEAFGAAGALLCAGTAHPWSQKVLRASAGSALRLPLVQAPPAAVLLAQLRIAGLRTVAASLRAETLPSAYDFRGPTALWIGNEASGLPPSVEQSVDARVGIPLAAGVDSLNAAVAASVLLYEAARQRGGLADAPPGRKA